MKGDDCGDRLPLSIPQDSLVPGSDPGLRMWLERGDAETQRSFKRLRRWSSLPIYVQPELHDAHGRAQTANFAHTRGVRRDRVDA